MKFFIQPFGCQMNRSDAERLEAVLESMGYARSEDENDPEVAIKGIIACSVRQKAIDRVYGRIRNWNRQKARQPCITFITGCILDADRQKFLKMFDLIFSIDQLPEFPDMIHQYGVALPGSLPFSVGAPSVDEPGRAEAARRIEEFWKLKPRYSSDIEAFVPIQNGCDKFCTYCAVPYTRGREVSRPSANILDEVQQLVSKGFQSITLLGQNVNSYGLDKKGDELSFPELMRRIGEIGRKSGREFWTYFTSPHPRDFTTELLEVVAEYEVLADWVHLPIQSGDDEVLRKMNRSYTMERYRQVVTDIRRILPGASLFTDIIVGFTGETRAQFEATAAAMREFRYDMAYIAQYSPRPGAASARWIDDIAKEEKEQRFQELSSLMVELAAPANAARVGQVLRVLVTSKARQEGYLSGYTEGRVPVRLIAEESVVGNFVDAEIVSARPLSLEGRIIKGKTAAGAGGSLAARDSSKDKE